MDNLGMENLGYAFNWLVKSIGGNIMFGQMILEQFPEARLPQKAQSAFWAAK